MGAFGEKLRKQREQRGLALDAISNTTKISTRMLRALEDEHFDQLPGGVFNKGFVRAYARQVGLDEEETVTDYLTALRESQVQSQKILPDFRSPGGKPGPVMPTDSRHHVLPADAHPGGSEEDNGRPNLSAGERRRNDERRSEVRRLRDRDPREQAPSLAEPAKQIQHVNAAGLASFTDGQTRVQRPHDAGTADLRSEARHNDGDQHYTPSSLPGFITSALSTQSPGETAEGARSSTLRISKPVIVTAALVLLAVAGLAIRNARGHRDNTVVAQAVTRPAELPAAAVSSVSAPALAAASASAPSPKGRSTSPAAKSSATKNSASSPVPSIKLSTANPPPKPASNLDAPDTFVVTPPVPASKGLSTFTLMIRADQTTWISLIADGKPETHETLIAPVHTSIRATRDVIVKVGNAAGVSFQLNGKEFPAQGSAGEVRSYVFDASGMRPGPSVPSSAANH